MKTAIKVALGMICFGIGAAGVILTICMLPFISATGAGIPGMLGALGAMFLWISFLLLRQLRWHND